MKLFDILKSRWQEAIMVAGLQACCMILLQDLRHIQDDPSAFGRLFMMGVGMAAFVIISQMLFWGFVRTALVGGVQSVGLMELLKTGKGYFWKMLFFQLMLFPVFVLIILAVTSGVQMVLYGHVKQDDVSEWLNMVGATAASLILIKPVYFVPAQIVRKDCGIMEAVRNLGQTRLLKMRYFLIMAVSLMIISSLIDYQFELIKPQSVYYFPVLGVQAVLSAAGMLVLFLAAALEVDRLMPKKTEDPSENEAGQ
jgi:hypothetical protein